MDLETLLDELRKLATSLEWCAEQYGNGEYYDGLSTAYSSAVDMVNDLVERATAE
jgi:hypothetical protein